MDDLAGVEPKDDRPGLDGGLLDLWIVRLGLTRPTDVRQLHTGRSGSLVFALQSGSDSVVMKATTDPKRLDRAQLEVDLLQSGALDGVAPQLLAADAGPGWVALATRGVTALPPADQVDRTTWLSLAGTIAAVHSRAVDTATLPRHPAPRDVIGGADLRPWTELGAEADARRGAQQVLAWGPSSLPLGLEHGDSHLDNVLRDRDGMLVWIDWQDATAGDGLRDLVFLWQRAEFGGAHPPRAEMTAAYAEARGLDQGRVRSLLDQVELRLLLEAWPPFLGYGAPESRALLRKRLCDLVNR